MPSIAWLASGFQRPPVSRTSSSFARAQRSSESISTPSRSKITARIPTALTISPILGTTNGMRLPRATVPLLRRLRATRTGVAAATALAVLALLSGLALGAGGGAEIGIPTLQAATAAPALGPDMAASSEERAARRQRSRERQAVARTLARTSFIARGGTRRREIALTFDDGPGPDTPRIMRVLRRAGAPATFFFVGQQLDFFGSILRAQAH